MVMMIRTSGSGTSITGLGGLRLSGAGRGLTASQDLSAVGGWARLLAREALFNGVGLGLEFAPLVVLLGKLFGGGGDGARLLGHGGGTGARLHHLGGLHFDLSGFGLENS